jgi:hypothetical protein
MTIARFLLTGCVLAVAAGSALAQPGAGYSFVPSVRPANAEDEPPPVPVARPARAAVSLEGMTTGAPPGAGDPVGTLVGAPAAVPGYPQGTYPSPYYTDGPGCCGPLGRDGRVGYEVHTYTGVNIPFGTGLADLLNAGWTVGGGVRTLFFDPTHTRAWTIDLGLSYTHNWAAGEDDPVNVFLRSPPTVNQFTGAVTAQPDRLVFTAIREVHRTSFNYSFGRDVWLWGSGNTGGMQGTNVRVGAWFGGRYGTSHVDQIPLNEVNGYSRRQNVFHGIHVGAHATYEVPMGAWVGFGGVRAEYGHDWTNLTPPLQGNIHYVNLQFTLGVRY